MVFDQQANSTPPPPGVSEARLGKELMGLELRAFLTLQMLDLGGPVRVRDLVAAVDSHGFTVAGRASKVISDSLRWEIVRGRVVRLGRGVYRAVGRVPRTTLRRMRQRVTNAMERAPRPVRQQPLRPPRPLVSVDGPWRYRRRYGIMKPPRTPWGYGFPTPGKILEPGATRLEEGLRARRRALDALRRSQPFGPYMV